MAISVVEFQYIKYIEIQLKISWSQFEIIKSLHNQVAKLKL